MTTSLSFNRQFDVHHGSPVTIVPGLRRITAPNASPYTFTGTNSFLVGDQTLFVIDPGPDDEGHLAALMAAIGAAQVKAIVLTHTHVDHSALAPKLAEAKGAPIWFAGEHRLSRPLHPGETNPLTGSCDWDLKPDLTLTDGEIIETDTTRLQVITTPGHCANHICLGVVGTPQLLSGDHVMGWNSTLVSVPDGSMADYLASLDKLLTMDFELYYPAHGGPIEDGKAYAAKLKAHRLARNDQIIDAVGARPLDIEALRQAIYPELPQENWRAAEMTLTAHLEYLEDLGKIVSNDTGNNTTYSKPG